MNTIFKNTGLAAILSAIVLLPSCDDEDTPKDQTLPLLSLTSSAAATTVWNTVTLTATASDDQGIGKIEIRIDGVSVGTATTSPYVFSWDTQTTTDGQHTATAIVTDQAGNQTTADLNLTVQNVLLEAKAKDGMLIDVDGNKGRGFIFLSDNDGKVIVAQEFKEGDAISLRAPGFSGSEFSITEVTTTSYYTPVSMLTTTHVNRGKWMLNVLYSNSRKQPAQTANLTFINKDENYQYLLIPNGYGDVVLPNNTGTVQLLASPSMLYVVRGGGGIPEPSKYHLFPAITTGANPTPLDLSLVNQALTTETFDMPKDLPQGTIFLYGARPGTGKTELYDLGGFVDFTGTMTIVYPGDAFPAYWSVTNIYGPELHSVIRARKRYDLTPLAATTDASYNDGKFTVAASGTMDWYYLKLSKDTEYYWTVLAEKNITSVTIPELPAILDDIVTIDKTDMRFVIGATDYAEIDGYSGLLNFIRTAENGYDDLDAPYSESKELYRYVGYDAGGRQSSRKKR